MLDDGEGGLWFGSQLGLVHYVAKSRSYEMFGKASGKSAADGFTLGSVFSIEPYVWHHLMPRFF